MANKDIEKSDWLNEFSHQRPDLALPANWSPEKKAKVAEEIRPNKTRSMIFSSIPIKCKGDACPFKSTCPLYEQGIHPLNYPCPIEMSMIQQFMIEYMDELGVNPDNLIEVAMIRDLVDQEIQYLRKTKILSQEHFIQENVVGVDSQGKVVMKKELHTAVELEDRLHKRKKDLRNQLLATRESRAKAGQASKDVAQTISQILQEVDKLERNKVQELKRASGADLIDEYIEDAEIIVGE